MPGMKKGNERGGGAGGRGWGEYGGKRASLLSKTLGQGRASCSRLDGLGRLLLGGGGHRQNTQRGPPAALSSGTFYYSDAGHPLAQRATPNTLFQNGPKKRLDRPSGQHPGKEKREKRPR